MFRAAKKTERKASKGKGKETYPGYFGNPLRSARACVRVKRPKPTCSYEFAGAAADEVAKTVWGTRHDREEIAATRERRMRRRLRKLPPKMRKFCLVLKRVMLDEKGPEIYIREKVCSACKISTRTYFLNIEKLHKLLP